MLQVRSTLQFDLFATSHRQCGKVFSIRGNFAPWLPAQGQRNFNAAMEKSCAFIELHRLRTCIRQWRRFGR
ncbi:MAG TPA: hypothetical protein PLL92_03660 [Alicycliphilus sp.]|nr:hypothetical protein [Alicycliphilus sp.]